MYTVSNAGNTTYKFKTKDAAMVFFVSNMCDWMALWVFDDEGKIIAEHAQC